MASFAPDTSCIVAALCVWHEHHERAAAELNRRLAGRQRMIVAAPALVETYAVLTRLPPPHRLSPADALRLIAANFFGRARIVALEASRYVRLLRRSPEAGVVGGRVYDAIIAECAAKAKVACLLTFNDHHFASLADLGLEIVVP